MCNFNNRLYSWIPAVPVYTSMLCYLYRMHYFYYQLYAVGVFLTHNIFYTSVKICETSQGYHRGNNPSILTMNAFMCAAFGISILIGPPTGRLHSRCFFNMHALGNRCRVGYIYLEFRLLWYSYFIGYMQLSNRWDSLSQDKNIK